MTDPATYPDPETFERAWAQLVAASWSDPAAKQRLERDPAGALAAEGVHLPPHLTVRAQPGASDLTVFLPLPARPARLGEVPLANDGQIVPPGAPPLCCCCCSC
jgi:hypothetical protein